MPLSPSLLQRLERAWPPAQWDRQRVIVAVSGGADSVALFRLLWAASVRQPAADGVGAPARGSPAADRLLLAHYHHGLRAEAADRDAEFVRQLAAQFGCSVDIGYADATAPSRGDEASLRRDRYRFLLSVARRHRAAWVATGHTRDDNVETVLHQMFRGTGPAGLSGIAPQRPLRDPPGETTDETPGDGVLDSAPITLVRPLLDFGRDELRQFLRDQRQPWCEDATNADLRWKRNWIRQRLLPQVRAEYPDAEAAVARLVDHQGRLVRWLDRWAADWSARCLRQEGSFLEIDRQRAASLESEANDPLVIVAALRSAWDAARWPRGAMTADHWNRLAALVADPDRRDRFDLPGSLRVEARGPRVRIERPAPSR